MRRVLVVMGGAIALFAAATFPAFAQPSDDIKNLQKEVDALKESQKTIQNDLQEIKNLLQRARAAAPPQEAVVSIDGAVVKGDKNAKVTLVDFTDYQ